MFNLDDITNEINKEYNEKWPYIPDRPSRISIIGGSRRTRRTNAMPNLIKEQDDFDNIYLYTKYLSEPKYQFLIEKRENVGIRHLNNSNSFTECSNNMDDVYEDINEYNPTRKRKILFAFDNMITEIMSN